MRKLKDVTIDGMRFRLQQMPGMAAYLLFNELVQVVVPGLTQLAGLKGAASEGGGLGGIPVDKIAPALAAIIPNLTRDRQQHFTAQLLESVVYIRGGQEVMPVLEAFDEIFAGNVFAAYQLMAHTIGVNFGNFQSALGALGAARQTQTGTSPSGTSDTLSGPPSA